ncbi:hypothetical protein ACFQV4_01610 [Streptomyces thermocarboxydus]
MSRRPRLTGRPLLLRRPRRFRRPRPRSLRSRLVLIACLLATSAVLVCQLAGLTVLRGWLTDQVDERLSHFRPPDRVARDMAEDRLRPRPGPHPPPTTASSSTTPTAPCCPPSWAAATARDPGCRSGRPTWS